MEPVSTTAKSEVFLGIPVLFHDTENVMYRPGDISVLKNVENAAENDTL